MAEGNGNGRVVLGPKALIPAGVAIGVLVVLVNIGLQVAQFIGTRDRQVLKLESEISLVHAREDATREELRRLNTKIELLLIWKENSKARMAACGCPEEGK